MMDVTTWEGETMITITIVVSVICGFVLGVLSVGLFLKAALPGIMGKAVDVMIAQGYLSIGDDNETLILKDKRGSRIELKADIK